MKISEPPSGIKAKNKRKMLPSKRWKWMVRIWVTAARQSSLQTGLMLNQELCNEAERTPDSPWQGLLRIFSDFNKVISKVYFNMACPLWQPVIIKGAWQQSLKDPSTLWWRFNNTKSRCPAELRCVTLDQQEALPCPRGPQLNMAEASWVGSHDRRGRGLIADLDVPLTI